MNRDLVLAEWQRGLDSMWAAEVLTEEFPKALRQDDAASLC